MTPTSERSEESDHAPGDDARTAAPCNAVALIRIFAVLRCGVGLLQSVQSLQPVQPAHLPLRAGDMHHARIIIIYHTQRRIHATLR